MNICLGFDATVCVLSLGAVRMLLLRNGSRRAAEGPAGGVSPLMSGRRGAAMVAGKTHIPALGAAEANI